LLKGLAGIILGFFLLTEPAATIAALTTLLGFYWLVQGVLSLVQVFVDRSIPWIWSLLTGIVGIIAGLFVLRHPLIAALTVPTVIVIILGVQGADHGCVGDRQWIQRRRFRVIFPGGDKPPYRLTAAQFAYRGGISGSDCFWSAPAD
jgi:uncharacterized membrane protein HdeD (DUF308 family)